MPHRDVLLAAVVAIALVFWVVGDTPREGGLDVAVVGDSFAEQSRDQFLALAAENGLTTEYFAFGGTALCGWEEELHDLAEQHPAHLILSFAGNDVIECMNGSGQPREPEVVAADYRQDLEETIELFRATRADIHVVLPPPVDDPAFEAYAEAMREMYREVALAHPRLSLIHTAPALGPDGDFHPALPCTEDEVCGPDGMVVLRQDDGIHLTPEGGWRYAKAMFEVVDES